MAGFWGKKDNLAESQGSVVQEGAGNVVRDAYSSTQIGSAQSNIVPRAVLPTTSSSDTGKMAPLSKKIAAELSSNEVEHFIGSGTKLKANVHFDSPVLIDGNLEGELFCSSTITIGPNGSVTGPIHCRSFTVQGLYKGSAKVQSLAAVKSGAKLIGNLECGGFAVEEGANINCEVKVCCSSETE